MKSKKTKNKFQQFLNVQYITKNLLAISMLAFMASCSKSSDETNSTGGGGGGGSTTLDCSGPAKSFVTDVRPVMLASCGSCHGAGSGNGPGALTTYTEIFNSRNIIRAAVISGNMPLNGTLTAAQKNAIVCWIDNGAPNN